MYTANAATANKCFAFVSLSAWRIAFWHKAMSPKPDASSLLVSGRGLIWMYTANAATASNRSCDYEPVGMDSLLFQFFSVCLVGSLLTKETLGFFKHTAKFIHVPWSDQHTVPSRRF
jgi:hypothetical protein